ncbi:uncharacterized protein [Palaemon carinicauda]|uniref:uncharacterized protein n=1 Tax=Palaemon carinicauda TaxID=392227 RepID=UPI0035B59868
MNNMSQTSFGIAMFAFLSLRASSSVFVQKNILPPPFLGGSAHIQAITKLLGSISSAFSSIELLYDESNSSLLVMTALCKSGINSSRGIFKKRYSSADVPGFQSFWITAMREYAQYKEYSVSDNLIFHQSQGEKLVLILSFHHDILTKFITSQSEKWTTGPLLLVNLKPHTCLRNVLITLNEIHKSSLLQMKQSYDGGPIRYNVISYNPFSSMDLGFTYLELNPAEAILYDEVFPERFCSFHGYTLQVASFTDDFPNLFSVGHAERRVMGFAKSMLDALGNHLNFSYNLQEEVPLQIRSYGQNSSGAYRSDILGQVIRREKDIIVNRLYLEDENGKLEFSYPFATSSYSALLKMTTVNSRVGVVASPFTAGTWLVLALSLFTITIVFHWIVKGTSVIPLYHYADMLSTMLWLTRPLVNQPVPRIAKVPGCQLILYFWWMMALVLTTTYSSKLMAFVFYPEAGNRITSIQEIKNSNRQMYATDQDNFLPNFLNDAILSKRIIFHPNETYIKEQVIHDKAVYVGTTFSLTFITSKWLLEDIYFVQEKFGASYEVWAFQKGAPWKHVIDKYIKRLVSFGLVMKWERNELTSHYILHRHQMYQGYSSQPSNTESRRNLSLSDFSSSFAILGAGYVIGSFVLCLEITIDIFTVEKHGRSFSNEDEQQGAITRKRPSLKEGYQTIINIKEFSTTFIKQFLKESDVVSPVGRPLAGNVNSISLNSLDSPLEMIPNSDYEMENKDIGSKSENSIMMATILDKENRSKKTYSGRNRLKKTNDKQFTSDVNVNNEIIKSESRNQIFLGEMLNEESTSSKNLTHVGRKRSVKLNNHQLLVGDEKENRKKKKICESENHTVMTNIHGQENTSRIILTYTENDGLGNLNNQLSFSNEIENRNSEAFKLDNNPGKVNAVGREDTIHKHLTHDGRVALEKISSLNMKTFQGTKAKAGKKHNRKINKAIPNNPTPSKFKERNQNS